MDKHGTVMKSIDGKIKVYNNNGINHYHLTLYSILPINLWNYLNKTIIINNNKRVLHNYNRCGDVYPKCHFFHFLMDSGVFL